MELQAAAHWATLVTTGIVVVAPIIGLAALWWKRRKQNQRFEEVFEYMRPAFEAYDSLGELSAERVKALTLKEKQLSIEQAQLLSVIATLEKSELVQLWNFALTHARYSELPDWLQKKLGLKD